MTNKKHRTRDFNEVVNLVKRGWAKDIRIDWPMTLLTWKWMYYFQYARP